MTFEFAGCKPDRYSPIAETVARWHAALKEDE